LLHSRYGLHMDKVREVRCSYICLEPTCVSFVIGEFCELRV